MRNPGHHAPVCSYAVVTPPPSSLQARSKHRPFSGQRAAALLSLAKQLRAAAASTAVTCVKRAFLLTHKHTRGRRPRHSLRTATVQAGGAHSASYGQKGDGLGHSHSQSAVPKHVPPQAQHTARTHTCRITRTSSREQRKHTRCTAAHVLPRKEGVL